MINFNNGKTLFSIEVFPPKDSAAIAPIYVTMGRFKALNPDYISVTYGAGGSGVCDAVTIASDIRNKFDIESVAHLTCAGSQVKDIDVALTRLEQNGVKNILALRGDRHNQFSDFEYATDLIKHINKRGGFSVCATCYPEGHFESGNKEKDFDILKMKADLGVTHFISQLFFDNRDFIDMLDGMAKRNIKVPTEAGIMPVTSAKRILKMVNLSNAKLTEKLTRIISGFEDDKAAIRCAGINYAVDQITELIAIGVSGIHLYAMNSPDTAECIYNRISPMIYEKTPNIQTL
ncbi:MAG: methylenetetrahydrofolate reductase [Christensenellaceae bacterium]|jgi:methylenetetrahydrofolate reductase (NADPH)|nr:methylenetetrahydrofolate reductase [Christensenellaceae bacterium]